MLKLILNVPDLLNLGQSDTIWMANLTCLDVAQVMEAVLQQQRHQMEHLDNFVFSPRLPRDILIVVGGSDFGYPLNLIEAYDCRTWNWSVVDPGDFGNRILNY